MSRRDVHVSSDFQNVVGSGSKETVISRSPVLGLLVEL